MGSCDSETHFFESRAHTHKIAQKITIQHDTRRITIFQPKCDMYFDMYTWRALVCAQNINGQNQIYRCCDYMVVRLHAVPSTEDRAKLCQPHRFVCLRVCMPLSIPRTDMNLLNKSCASTLHFAKFLITLRPNLNVLASTVSCLTTPGYCWLC